MKSKILSIFVFTLLTSSLLGIVITAEEESFIKENYESIVFSEPNIIEGNYYTTIEIEEATSYLMNSHLFSLLSISSISFLILSSDS